LIDIDFENSSLARNIEFKEYKTTSTFLYEKLSFEDYKWFFKEHINEEKMIIII